jgi:hypothetical protein
VFFSKEGSQSAPIVTLFRVLIAFKGPRSCHSPCGRPVDIPMNALGCARGHHLKRELVSPDDILAVPDTPDPTTERQVSILFFRCKYLRRNRLLIWTAVIHKQTGLPTGVAGDIFFINRSNTERTSAA